MDDEALRELLSPYMYNLHECLRCASKISRACGAATASHLITDMKILTCVPAFSQCERRALCFISCSNLSLRAMASCCAHACICPAAHTYIYDLEGIARVTIPYSGVQLQLQLMCITSFIAFIDEIW